MTRLISGVVLAAAALAALLTFPPVALRLLASVVAAFAAHEYLRIAWASNWSQSSSGERVGGVAANSDSILTGGTLPVAAAAATSWFVSGWPALAGTPLLLLAFALVAVYVLFANQTVQHAASEAFALVYLGVPLGLLAAIHLRHGAWITLLLIATIVVSDSAQYYCGRAFGRRKLAPAISPKKTIEGALGGLIVATIFLVIAGMRLLPGAAPVPLAVTGVSLVALGICGDLFESRLKRDAGVKDSSALIPGHGGVLDRIDALLFATPAFYLYLRTLGGEA
jgi:phosphatidate cytidylyltransferase